MDAVTPRYAAGIDLHLLLFRLERAGDPSKAVSIDELRGVCREAKHAIRELITQGEKK